jgi:predicted GNAT superfamily acetyltransferase
MVVQLRPARVTDHPHVIEAIKLWWQDSRTAAAARELSLLVPRLFLEHFAGTSLIAEREGEMVGFLVGFHSQDHADEAYIHFVGVAPEARKGGLARQMYESFFATAKAAGRTKIGAVTSPRNTGSIAFHTRLGFTVTLPSPDDHEQFAKMVRLPE